MGVSFTIVDVDEERLNAFEIGARCLYTQISLGYREGIR